MYDSLLFILKITLLNFLKNIFIYSIKFKLISNYEIINIGNNEGKILYKKRLHEYIMLLLIRLYFLKIQNSINSVIIVVIFFIILNYI